MDKQITGLRNKLNRAEIREKMETLPKVEIRDWGNRYTTQAFLHRTPKRVYYLTEYGERYVPIDEARNIPDPKDSQNA